MRRLRLIVFNTLWVSAIILAGLAQNGPSPSIIRVSSNLVSVPVSVTDTTGRPVRHLKVEDFEVEEEGISQTVTLLGEPGQTPLELALTLDISGSTRERFRFQQQVAGQFLKEVFKAGDAISVFSIGRQPRPVLARTGNATLAIARIITLEATHEATAFFDTVAEAARQLRRTAQPGSRRVQVVISDGEDNHSERYGLTEAQRELQRADCVFYAINPSGPSIWLNKISMKGQKQMELLAANTGGRAFLATSTEDLRAIFQRITVELQTQYLLGYYARTASADGRFRQIRVRVPKQPDLSLQARQGYFAPTQ